MNETVIFFKIISLAVNTLILANFLLVEALLNLFFLYGVKMYLFNIL